jgi:hypothetical protein
MACAVLNQESTRGFFSPVIPNDDGSLPQITISGDRPNDDQLRLQFAGTFAAQSNDTFTLNSTVHIDLKTQVPLFNNATSINASAVYFQFQYVREGAARSDVTCALEPVLSASNMISLRQTNCPQFSAAFIDRTRGVFNLMGWITYNVNQTVVVEPSFNDPCAGLTDFDDGYCSKSDYGPDGSDYPCNITGDIPTHDFVNVSAQT